MSESNPFLKFQKHAGRAKEKLRQNLGKADKTTDEDFDLHVKNFNNQQQDAVRLQKEIKNYHQSLKGLQQARRSLLQTISELYEPCWDGVEEFLIKSEVNNKQFEDFCFKVNNDVMLSVASYVQGFPDISTKISKRSRKLLDYDNCRHKLQSLQAMKKREETKIAKAKDQMEDAYNLFDVINVELHEELPTLYDSRVAFFASNLKALFLAEAEFHDQDKSSFMDLSKIMENLNDASAKSDFADKSSRSISTAAKHPSTNPDLLIESKTSLEEGEKKHGNGVIDCTNSPDIQCYVTSNREINENDAVSTKQEDQDSKEDSYTAFSTPPSTAERNIYPEMLSNFAEEKSAKKCEVEAQKDNILYQVRGTYRYTAEDSDELSFDVDDIIDVISFEDPEDQEEGWLMGVFNGQRGLFPANFTAPL